MSKLFDKFKMSRFFKEFEKIQKQQELIRRSCNIAAARDLTTPAIKMVLAFQREQELRQRSCNIAAARDLMTPAIKMAAAFQREQDLRRTCDMAAAHDLMAPAIKMVVAFQHSFNTIALSGAILSATKMVSIFQLKGTEAEGLIPKALLQADAVKLLDSLDSTHGNLEQNAIENDVEKIKDYIDKKCRTLSPGRINYVGVFSLLIMIIIFIYQSYGDSQDKKDTIASDSQTKEDIIEFISKSNKSLSDSIERLAPKEKDKEISYVIIRAVNLRSKPTTKSPVIEVLLPNQEVALIHSKKKWVYIKYFDLIEGLPKTGWVYKKYLKRAKRAGQGRHTHDSSAQINKEGRRAMPAKP